MNMFKKSAIALSVLALSAVGIPSTTASAYGSALWPVDSVYQEITTYFDESRNYGNSSAHNAIDIPADYGSNIYAVSDGVCISAGWQDDYGYLIILWHEQQSIYTFYSHCSSMAVYSGQSVSQGDVIGYVGSTGVASGNHLHFGICDSLLGGTPYVTYYNPLDYFSYDNKNTGNDNNPDNPVNECSCDSSYAGTYTTFNIDTYLNIRDGHGTDAQIIGSIPPDALLTVTKADGEWAHIEYNGISGCCAMEYLQKTGGIVPEITISQASVPKGTFEIGEKFSIKGILNSQLPIKKVWGGIYKSDGLTPVFVAEEFPDSLSYDLSGDFDRQITFNMLASGSYIYKVEAENQSGEKFTLISSLFYMGGSDNNKTGDVNLDGSVNVADIVLLQKYLLNSDALSAEQYANADVNRDSVVDVFDMVEMRSRIIGNIA